MKHKLLKSIAMLSLASTGVVSSQTSESDGNLVGNYNQPMDSIDHTYNPDDADMQENKGFGTGTYFLFLGASGATSNDSGLNYEYSGAGCMETISGGVVDGDFDMNLNLPDGHDILGYRLYFNDSAVNDISTTLFQFDGTGGLTIVAQANSAGDTGFGNTWSGNMNHIINNSSGAYVMRLNLTTDGPTQSVCGVRLFIDADPV